MQACNYEAPQGAHRGAWLCVLGYVSAACYQPAPGDGFGGYNGDAVDSYEDAGPGGETGDERESAAPPSTARAPAAGRDAGGRPGVTPTADAAANGAKDGPTSLSFSVLTVSLAGRYAPRNVGAVWVEDASGSFVKTLELWARTRQRYLTTFLAASGGDTTDAVTSATLAQHRAHAVTWDLTDSSGAVVADGEYQVRVEITDYNGPGDTIAIPFTKGPAPSRLTPADAQHFIDMSLVYE